MKTTIIVEGLKCHHCEMHVEETLKKIPGVKEAKADKDLKEVVIDSDNAIEEAVIEKAVKEAGYTFKSIK